MKYLTSAFSLQMCPQGAHLEIKAMPADEFRRHTEGGEDSGSRFIRSPGWDVSAVGHEGTAHALTKLTGFPVSVNRASIAVKPGDTLLVAMPAGTRLVPVQEIPEPILSYFLISVLGDRAEELKSTWSAGYEEARRKFNPHWLDEDEAREETASRTEATKQSCPKCGIEISPEMAMQISIFGAACVCGYKQ